MLRPALLAALVAAARARIGIGDTGVCTALLNQAGCQALADDAGFVPMTIAHNGYTIPFLMDSDSVAPGCFTVDYGLHGGESLALFGFGDTVAWYWNDRTHATSTYPCGSPSNLNVVCYCADEVVLADWGQTCADVGRADLVTPGQCDYAYQLLQEEYGTADEFPDVTTVGNGMTWGDPPVTYMSGLSESPLSGASACFQTKPAGQTYPGLYSLFFYAGSSYAADPEVRPICGAPLVLVPSPPPPPLAPYGCPAWDAVGFQTRTNLNTIFRTGAMPDDQDGNPGTPGDGSMLTSCANLKKLQDIEPVIQGKINHDCCGGNSPFTSCRDTPDPTGAGLDGSPTGTPWTGPPPPPFSGRVWLRRPREQPVRLWRAGKVAAAARDAGRALRRAAQRHGAARERPRQRERALLLPRPGAPAQ